MTLFARIFAKPDPKRFAPAEVPAGWIPPPEVKARKRSGDGIYIIDEASNTYGFADKPFETVYNNQPETLTDRDIAELSKRNLDPYNPAYAAAKKLFVANPGISKSDLSAQIPGVARETFKDVLASFRAAARSPIE